MVFVSEYGWEHRAEEVDDSSDSISWIVKADTGVGTILRAWVNLVGCYY